MGQAMAELRALIAELRAKLGLLAEKLAGEADEFMRELIAEKSATLQNQLAAAEAELVGLAAVSRSPVAAQSGAATIGGGTVYGPLTGFNSGNITVTQFFGGQPAADHVELLAAYLETVRQECQRLRLDRLPEHATSGTEQHVAPSLTLQQVFTNLACADHEITLTAQPIQVALKRAREWQDAHDPVAVAAPQARQILVPGVHDFKQAQDADLLAITVTRPELALEAIARQQRLVLLGDPGAGKSTVLRYLALLLAEALLANQTWLPVRGWRRGGRGTPIPLLCPLADVAAAVFRERAAGQAADVPAILSQVLTQRIEGKGEQAERVRSGLGGYVQGALRRGAVLVMFDGLDEIPVNDASGQPLRKPIADAIRAFSADVPAATLVVTSRIRPYRDPAGGWQLGAGWTERTLAPFAFGQVRQFLHSWYAANAALPNSAISQDDALGYSADLIAQLAANERVRRLTESPLLATMLALVHLNKKQLPHDRAELYHDCVELLLDRWESRRSWALEERPSLVKRLNIPNLTRETLRSELHAIAFDAHRRPPNADGRGIIEVDALEGRLLRFFRRLKVPEHEILGKQQLFLQALQDETGLLHALSTEEYALPHLTFQEYLAACHLADTADPAQAAYKVWASSERDRWREVLLLMMGRIRQQSQAARSGVPWIELLLQTKLGSTPKSSEQHQRDVALALVSYREMGGSGALASSQIDPDERMETPLRRRGAALLEITRPVLLVNERIEAAERLADLGDPRFPVTPDQWRAEPLPTEFTREGTHYWRYIPGGTYQIGGWQPDKPGAEITLQPFWMARFPVTIVQYAAFIAAGGYQDETLWTPQGWQWKHNRQQPEDWRNQFEKDARNQPVVGVSWYEALACSRWLASQCSVPDGYSVRLPSEAEWEVMVAYDSAGGRQIYPWGADEPTSNYAIYDEPGRSQPAPIGTCPAGRTAGGVWDAAGNAWEWTASRWLSYPHASILVELDCEPGDWGNEETLVSLRGSSYRGKRIHVRCAARGRNHPDSVYNDGFRVCVAPHTH